MYIFFLGVSSSINEKKNVGAETGWATAQSYCKRKGFCIAIQSMYCKLEGLDRLSIVLQHV